MCENDKSSVLPQGEDAREIKVKKVKNKKPIRYYMTTFVTVCALALLQIVIFVVGLSVLSEIYFYIEIACWCISLLVVFLIVNRKVSASYKLAWCVPILLFPVCGGLAYVIARSRQAHKKFLKKAENAKHAVRSQMPENLCDCSFAEQVCPRLSRYLAGKDCPGYDGTETTYFGSGEEMYASMMEALKGARHFIFMEFFIIREGNMWQSILALLREKVKEGVDVRILYDGMGSVKCLPMRYDKKLRAWGINARVFHPFVPVISTMQNNRDHKKIVVVDGKVAYTGGINISDEYIGLYDRCGKWKDSGVMLTGKGIAGLTRIFLEMWYLDSPVDGDVGRFFPARPECESEKADRDAFSGRDVVIPYADTPVAEDNLGEKVYIDVISHAKNTLYIMTPYFIPGEALLDSICMAAESGVDVRLIAPHVGDKTFIHAVTRSYYGDLLAAGVRVYEYTPGFIHSKVFVCDDALSTVGTVNLDYRSLYLHFECGTVICSEKTAREIKTDFLQTLTQCTEITEETVRKRSPFVRLFTGLLRLFEPLL